MGQHIPRISSFFVRQENRVEAFVSWSDSTALSVSSLVHDVHQSFLSEQGNVWLTLAPDDRIGAKIRVGSLPITSTQLQNLDISRILIWHSERILKRSGDSSGRYIQFFVKPTMIRQAFQKQELIQFSGPIQTGPCYSHRYRCNWRAKKAGRPPACVRSTLSSLCKLQVSLEIIPGRTRGETVQGPDFFNGLALYSASKRLSFDSRCSKG
ncbi:hypothetical protein RRG08_036713 [Elysia crispata]|uniref:Uncharacterized protein n=1 Tax=Elysia crispata TaxID=231223 RepID=A0AAE0XUC2_9GAST|nr:hypothetical protein RRG08_036713 [Elysia crispata]